MKKRVYLQGFGVDLKNFNEALGFAQNAIEEKKNLQVVTINPEMIELAKKNKEFAKVLNEAELVVPDGVGVKIAIRLKGFKQEQIRGVDFAKSLIELCAKNGYKLGLLGAKEEVLSALVAKLKSKYENLNIVFAKNGYFANESAILGEIEQTQPQVFLCALGAPKQEYIVYKLKNMLKGAVMVGVGGSFDVFAGYVKRAPKIWQKLGLEWLYRTIKQPERIKRIFPTLPIFLFKSIMDCKKK